MTIIAFFLLAQNEMYEPHNILKFADHLYAQKDYAAALNEYRRYLFLTEADQEGTYDRIIGCLIRLGRYSEGIAESENIRDFNKRDHTKGMIFFAAGMMDSSRTYLQLVDIPYKTDAQRIIGLSYAYEFKFDTAGKYIQLPPKKPSYKQPALGGLFSLIPGAGQCYAGRFGDGLYSFLIVSSAALLSYYYFDRDEDLKFGLTFGAALLLYAGNIYGGINTVRNYNYHENEKYLQQILDNQ
jgi:hypothetical protein